MSQEPRIEDVSDTALWVATYRARESERPDAVFRDPLAGLLAGERGKQIARSMPYASIMSWVMVARTSAIDRLILRAIELGADTVLNLGAGLDTRPYRMKLPSELRWIEVDFPHMIRHKEEKLAGQSAVCRLERIAQDLSDRKARRELFARVVSSSRQVVILTEGVIPYLPDDEVARLAEDLHEAQAFRHWIQDYYDGGIRFAPMRWRRKLRAAPFRFRARDWFAFFAEKRWRLAERITTFEEARRIGRPYPPIRLPWSLIFLLTPRRRREELRRMTGYAMLERS